MQNIRSHKAKNSVLIGSKLEVGTCRYLWMFFTKKRFEQEKKKTSGLEEKSQWIRELNLGPLDISSWSSIYAHPLNKNTRL